MNSVSIEQIIEIREKVRSDLSPSRFEHTLGVAYTAACMGMIYNEDPLKCELAGLLHDCAKNMTDEELIFGCKNAGISLSREELLSPQIIHSIYGAWLAETKFGIKDEDIINAVRYHTTGRASMSVLEKIIFIADFIEPLRTKAPCLREARHLAFRDIDRCMHLILVDTFEFLNNSGKPVEEKTIEAYNYFKAII